MLFYIRHLYLWLEFTKNVSTVIMENLHFRKLSPLKVICTSKGRHGLYSGAIIFPSKNNSQPGRNPLSYLQDFAHDFYEFTVSKIDLVRALNQIPVESTGIPTTAVTMPFGFLSQSVLFSPTQAPWTAW